MPLTALPQAPEPQSHYTQSHYSRLPLVEYRGAAMGSWLHIIATGEPSCVEPILAWAVGRVDQLEQLWSRFVVTSEVSLLNASPGQPCIVSDDTLVLVQAALEARELSAGRFDPTLLQAMNANGYDRTFVSIKTPVGLPALDTRRIGFGEITVDADAKSVMLASATGFDPGGIGKGLAADMVAEAMIQRGANGALVNIGGDVRCIGEGPADGAWVIAAGDAVANVAEQVLEIGEGAVASSTCRRRRWRCAAAAGVVDAHHLLDPVTGRPAAKAADLVTVIAARCADAEWIATAVASTGTLESMETIAGGATVMLTDFRGNYSAIGEPKRYLR